MLKFSEVDVDVAGKIVVAYRHEVGIEFVCIFNKYSKGWLPQFKTCRITSDEIRQCADKLDELNKC